MDQPQVLLCPILSLTYTIEGVSTKLFGQYAESTKDTMTVRSKVKCCPGFLGQFRPLKDLEAGKYSMCYLKTLYSQ